jgi:chromosomal replication initiation ATPase DnaA
MLQQVLPFHDIMIPELVVGNANMLAYRTLFEQKPLPCGLYWLQGEEGSGKSLLADYWQRSTHATRLHLAPETTPPLQPHDYYIIDPLPDAVPLHVPLFHLLTQMQLAQARLLVCSPHFPSNYPTILHDVSSRLKAAYVLPLAIPDDTMIKAIVLAHATMRQLRIDAETVEYMIPRMPRSCVGAAQLVAALDAHNLYYKHPITIPVVRHVLESIVV